MISRATERPARRAPGDAPADNLYRGILGGARLVKRDDDETTEGETGGSGNAAAADTTMVGYFAVFDVWTEICSWYEGEFLERLHGSAFTKTLQENRDRVKVQYDHGMDNHVGGSPLGPITELEADKTGVRYAVPLLDTDYNRERVLPLLQGRLMSGEMTGSLLGASFRFRVIADSWLWEPEASPQNPNALPERTILEVELMEFGPVVFPAYAEASAGMRSLTDHYLDRLRERAGHRNGAAIGTPETVESSPVAPPPGHSSDSGRSLAAAITETLKLKESKP